MNKDLKAGTAAQQSDAAEVPSSSQPCSNTLVMGSFVSNYEGQRIVQCCRCRHKHKKGDRIMVKKTTHSETAVCPKCRAESYYNCP